MSAEPKDELIKLEEQIKKAYSSYSIIDKVCTPQPVSVDIHYGQFSQFANKLLIEKEHITSSSHYLILGEIGTSVARNEIRHIVDAISDLSTKKELDEITYVDIKNSVLSLQSQHYKPNHIFLPIDFFHKLIDWNREKPLDFKQGSVFDQLFIDNYGALKVTYSNKYIPFDNVVITCKEANIWEYRPSSISNERMTAKFDWNPSDPINTILLVKTVFNFKPSKEGNAVLKARKIPTDP